MEGTPLPIAILERKWIDSTLTMVSRGRLDLAGIEFDMAETGNPSFTNKRGTGKFFCLFQSESLREPMLIAVGAPAAFDVPRNESQIVKYTWEQPLTITFATQTSSPWQQISAHTMMNRELVHHSHVSFPWVTELALDEESILEVTSSATDRQWMLAVWRMTPDEWKVADTENPNAYAIAIANSSSAAWSRTRLTDSAEWVHWYRVTNVSETDLLNEWVSLSNSFGTVWRPQFAHRIRWRIRRSATESVPDGGIVRTRVRKNNTTTVHSLNLSIPTDESMNTYEYTVAAGSFATMDLITVETDQCEPGEAFEISIEIEPIL